MLNEDRVILMTQMASYEEHEGKYNMKIGSYFRGDYIAVQILKAFFSITIAYALILALYVFYHLQMFTEDIYQFDILDFAKNVLLYYLVTVVVYGAVAYGVSAYRYMKARKNLKLYYKNLKKLNSMYNEG